jgi:hypothetical protein
MHATVTTLIADSLVADRHAAAGARHRSRAARRTPRRFHLPRRALRVAHA